MDSAMILAIKTKGSASKVGLDSRGKRGRLGRKGASDGEGMEGVSTVGRSSAGENHCLTGYPSRITCLSYNNYHLASSRDDHQSQSRSRTG